MVQVSGLLNALGSSFAVIALGSILRKTGVITEDHAAGVTQLIGKVALPALLFLSMSRIDFSGVDWYFILGIGITRCAVFAGVTLVSFLLDRRTSAPLSAGALRGICTTQSNDFALGLPVVMALYPWSITQLLFVVAPLQLVLINPVAFMLMEYGAVRAGLRHSATEGCKSVLVIVLRVLRNPIVFMTILGLIANAAFHGSPPQIVDQAFTTLGNAFAAGALLSLGGQLVSGTSRFSGKKVMVPILLIAVKCLLIPILSKIILNALGVGNVIAKDDGKVHDLALFGFIIGCIPSAPTVFVYANDYGILVGEMTQTIILCTIVSGPILFGAVELSQISRTPNNSHFYEHVLDLTVNDVSCLSLVAALWLMLLAVMNWRRRADPLRVPRFFVAALMLFFYTGLQTCRSGGLDAVTRNAVLSGSFYVLQLTQVLSCLWPTLQARDTRTRKILKCVAVAGGLTACGAALAVRIVLEDQCTVEDTCWYLDFREATSVVVAETVFFALCFLVVVAALQQLIRQRRSVTSSVATGVPVTINEGTLAEPLLIHERSDSSGSGDSSGRRSSGSSRSSDDDDGYGDSSGSSHRTSTVNTDPVLYTPFPDLVYVVFVCCSLLLSLIVRVYTLLESESTIGGVYLQFAFLDALFACLIGAVLCALVGFERGSVSPVLRLFRRQHKVIRHWWHSLDPVMVPECPFENLDPTVQKLVLHFEPHRPAFVAQFVRDRKHRLTRYCEVFRGSDLVTWLVQWEIASDRSEAVQIGKALVLARVVHHVLDEHHFEDNPYFYRFYRDVCLPTTTAAPARDGVPHDATNVTETPVEGTGQPCQLRQPQPADTNTSMYGTV
eukprot:m.35614 g.35614  ORF g.35614 m.35614 type:complete len:839 (+) comp10937_c0_seq1:363-2879(+)